MPTGIYKRSEQQLRQFRELHKSPKSPKQLKALAKGRKIAHKLPRTEAQLRVCRENGRKVGLSNNADMIVKHHNDLQHGALRPNDITLLSLSEHTALHSKLRNPYQWLGL